MRKFYSLFLGAFAGAVIALLATNPQYVVGIGAQAAMSPADVYKQLNLFANVFETVRAQHVDAPDEAKMTENAINGMLAGLDAHSSYMDAHAFNDMKTSFRGEFGGLGIEVTMEKGLVKVVAPIDDTPASKAGILSNDLVVEIDGEQVQGLTLQQCVDKMRGPVASEVKLTIMRPGQDDPIKKTLKRDTIKVITAKAHKEGDDVVYLRLTQFGGTTTELMNAAITKYVNEIGADKVKGFILDLRNNPGGLLNEAVTVTNAFVESGTVVTTRGRDGVELDKLSAVSRRFNELTRDKPLIVLVNGGSASASEIVAGSLQDMKRATIIGTRSFGKGSVQTIIPLPGTKAALRLTTARYFTSSGRSIQAKGVVPEIEVVQDEPAEVKGKTDTKGEASLKGHLKIEGQEATGSQSYIPPIPADDKALQLALELLRGTKTDPAFPPKTEPVSAPK